MIGTVMLVIAVAPIILALLIMAVGALWDTWKEKRELFWILVGLFVWFGWLTVGIVLFGSGI